MVLEPPSSTIITETDSETETTTKPCHSQPGIPVYKQKLTPASHTPFPIDNTPRKKQYIIHDFYGPNSWYNTPAITPNYQSSSTKYSQSLAMALNNSLSTTMTLKPLFADEYLELSTAIIISTSVVVTTTELEMADSLLYWERTQQCELHPSHEPTAKRQKPQVLSQKVYQTIASKLQEQVVTCTHESQILVVIDTTLKAHRAQKRADATIDLTNSPLPKPPPPLPLPAGLIPQSPLIKEETSTTPADASTANKSSAKPPATPRTYKWLHKPTTRLNTHIHDAAFLTTITTEYSGASTDITLTCTYNNNPQATLTAALSILGTTLSAEVLQKMFQYKPTESSRTLLAILKENNADKHFRFEDYNAAVADKNLTPGLNALFLGHSGPNFGETNGNTNTFNNSHIILCQIDCEAPKATNQNRSYQWALFFSSHEHRNDMPRLQRRWTKHAWVFGTELLDFFKDGNQSRTDRRLGKILFPHKADNATDIKLNSAVFLTVKSRNLHL
jgi:hypothetical protein